MRGDLWNRSRLFEAAASRIPLSWEIGQIADLQLSQHPPLTHPPCFALSISFIILFCSCISPTATRSAFYYRIGNRLWGGPGDEAILGLSAGRKVNSAAPGHDGDDGLRPSNARVREIKARVDGRGVGSAGISGTSRMAAVGY